MTVLFWDIDGTLLSTGRAGVFALEDATSEVAGAGVDLQRLDTAGLTDFQVASRILESAGQAATPEKVAALVRRYEQLLPASLHRRQGRVLEGVRELLDYLRADRPDVVSYLLTGNTAAGARAKLEHYGLAAYFPWGAFSTDLSDRATIARTALEYARARNQVTLDRIFVIGDTPYDIRCGQAIGVRTVAVASGEYSVDALSRHNPWLVIERLPAPAAFLSTIGLQSGPDAARATGA